jgi:hypothetical protein
LTPIWPNEQGGTCVTEAQRQLHQALKVHKFDLEIERGAASDCDLEERIEATRRVLKWLEQATFRQAQPEACTLHQDVNLLLGKIPSRTQARENCGPAKRPKLKASSRYSGRAAAGFRLSPRLPIREPKHPPPTLEAQNPHHGGKDAR